VQEGGAGFARQLGQHAVDGLEVFEDQLLGLGRRLLGLGDQHQFVEPGLFQCGAAKVVKQQALGDGRQKGPGLAWSLQSGAAQQAHESVLAEVFGPLRAGHVASQPRQQPAAMVAIKRSNQLTVGVLD